MFQNYCEIELDLIKLAKPRIPWSRLIDEIIMWFIIPIRVQSRICQMGRQSSMLINNVPISIGY